jgi:hypothetical protein
MCDLLRRTVGLSLEWSQRTEDERWEPRQLVKGRYSPTPSELEEIYPELKAAASKLKKQLRGSSPIEVRPFEKR